MVNFRSKVYLKKIRKNSLVKVDLKNPKLSRQSGFGKNPKQIQNSNI